MQWNWLIGLIYGCLGGFFEFLPVAPQVHQKAFLKLVGVGAPGYGLSLAVHLGALTAVIFTCYGSISKLAREQKLLRQSKRLRKRQPDFVSLVQIRLLKFAAVPMTISCIAAPWFGWYMDRLWLMAILTAFSGILVLLPNYMTRANKDARGMSPLDAVLIGLGGILGLMPGFSRVGALTSIASMRGVDRQFALDFVYLLLIPVLAALCICDLAMLMIAGDPLAGVLFWPGVWAAAAAFAAGIAGIRLMQFLAVKAGYESLAYYSWGLSMFAFIVYLIG